MNPDADRLVSSEALVADNCFRRVGYEGNAHIQVFERICHLRFLADESRHYSPYAALVQSSGVGKTRCVMEMATLGVYICYCSLAGSSSSAYPPRTKGLADKLVKSFTELEAVLYLKAWLIVLADALREGVSALSWKESQLPGSGNTAEKVLDAWEALTSETSAEYAEKLEVMRDRDLVNWSILGKAAEDVVANLERSKDNEMVTSDDEAEMSRDPRVIFVFDEARGLLPSETAALGTSPFCQLRRALRSFFSWPPFFALILDTSAKITTNLLLPRRNDEDSSRALKIGIHLLPPIYYMPTLRLNLPRPGLSLEEYTRPATWMKYGRPLWAARMVSQGENGMVLRDRLLEFAKQKLMGPDFNNELLTESQAMALLAAATGLQVCPRSPLAETMAASHMNIVLRVTDDRSRVFVALSAEPILSEAAASLLRNEEVKQRTLIHMEAACMAGYTTAGPRGEFAAKFILSATVWSYAEKKKSQWYLKPIKIRDFLRQLLVNNTNRDDAAFASIESKLPAGGVVFFLSFVQVGRVPDVGMLGKCFAAGQAIMYQADNTMPGADLIIPISTPVGMTCVVISVKNIAEPGWMESLSLDVLRSEFTKVEVASGLCVVTVLMSLREPVVVKPLAWFMWDEPDPRHVQLSLYGIDNNYGYLSREVKALLKAILVARPGPIQGASPEERKWVEQMLPYEFEQADGGFASVGMETP